MSECEKCTKEAKNKKKMLRFCDVLVILTFILFLGTHITTHFYMAKMQDAVTAAGNAAQVSEVLELNPIASYIMRFQNLAYIYTAVILPAVVFGGYYIMRRWMKDGIAITYAVTIAFIAAMINVLNDVSVYLGTFT